MEYLDKQNIKVIEHPSYRPDLNPIEHIWAWMKSEITKDEYKTIEELIIAIENKWETLNLNLQNSVIDHHMDVIQDRLAADGRYI